MWIAAYGPKALQLTGEIGDGFILQLADPDITAWTIKSVREAAAAAGRDPASVTDLRGRARVRRRRPRPPARAVPLVRRDGRQPRRRHRRPVRHRGRTCRRALTDYIAGRQGYDYNEHGRAGNTHTAFVPDEIVDRFCILGPVEEHVRRLSELAALGVDQFAVYLQHDGKDETLAAYGEQVIPAVTELLPARS